MCACVVDCVRGERTANSICEHVLSSYLRFMYSLKNVANVMQDRNKDVKMKTVMFELLILERLLPSTGGFVPLLRKTAQKT